MDFSLNKNAWKSLIPAHELDQHMIKTKQVFANVKILNEMISDFPFQINSKILIPGCGTGQVFDFLDNKKLTKCELVCTDINESYLEKAKSRLDNNFHYQLFIDDIEKTKLNESFDACILVLVLEHTHWNLALQNIINLGVKSFYIIVQDAEVETDSVSVYPGIHESIKKFSNTAILNNITQNDIELFFRAFNFSLRKTYTESVLGGKKMIGMVFKLNR